MRLANLDNLLHHFFYFIFFSFCQSFLNRYGHQTNPLLHFFLAHICEIAFPKCSSVPVGVTEQELPLLWVTQEKRVKQIRISFLSRNLPHRCSSTALRKETSMTCLKMPRDSLCVVQRQHSKYLANQYSESMGHSEWTLAINNQ